MAVAQALGEAQPQGPHRSGGGGAGGKRRPRWGAYLLLAPGMLWLALFFVVPIFSLFMTSLQTRLPGSEIGQFQQTFRLANYLDALREFQPQFVRSFAYAGVATVLSLAIGFPLAYAIAFKSGRLKSLLLVLVVAPFFTSFILRTVAWRQILADQGPVVSVLKDLHLLGSDGRLLSTWIAVVSGLTYNFLPFMTLPLYASLERVDPRVLEAAGDLYANGWTTLRRVTFPLAMPGVVAGTLLTFIPAAGDYVNASLLGNTRTQMVGSVIESRFLRVVDYPTAASLSFLLMAAILIIVMVYVRRAGTEELV